MQPSPTFRQSQQRSLQPVCSCSYPPQVSFRRLQPQRCTGSSREQERGRRGCGAWALERAPSGRECSFRSLRCAATPTGSGAGISGYTPANYISFSEDPRDVAPHAASIVVDAPASTCFNIWNDWNRLVEILDLVAQIGLDPKNTDLALFQCFYRHGVLPVMEIVFVLQKTEVVPDKLIAFESVWGMPMRGEVRFKELPEGGTQVELDFCHALPDLLVDLKVGVFGVQGSLIPVLRDNMEAFRQMAESAARDPAALPQRPEAGHRGYPLFDEEADMEEFDRLMEEFDFGEDEEEGEEGAGKQESGAAAQRRAPEASGRQAAAAAAAPAEPSGSVAAGMAAAGAAAGAAAVRRSGGAKAAAGKAGAARGAKSAAKVAEPAAKGAGTGSGSPPAAGKKRSTQPRGGQGR